MQSGDLRVARQEPGQESSRMPAWKREILERRKAKGGGSGAGAETVALVRSKSKDDITGSYTITPAKRGTQNPELEHWSSADPSDPRERLVLEESLVPLKENPFIKLEKERKRRQSRDTAARPVQHILELYGGVPGIRTIRAENIIIIETDPEFFPEGCGLTHAARLQQNGTASGFSSLNDLLERQGNQVTEIRAKEVVIYDTALSKSEENLSTLGRSEGQGRVNRILQKFDRNFGKLPPKSHSTENLLDLDHSLDRARSSRLTPDTVPKRPASPQDPPPRTDVFQNAQSSESGHHSTLSDPESPSPLSGSPRLVSSARRRFEAGEGRRSAVRPKRDAEKSSKPFREADWDSTHSKAKVPCSPESQRAHVEHTPSPTSPSFEIRPSPRPDLSLVPAGDLQARALANLRLQSRNSFTVIPKSRAAISSPGNTAPSSPVLSPLSARPLVGAAASEPTVPRLQDEGSTEAMTVSSQDASTSSPDRASPHVPDQKPTDDKLPITNIDDIDVGSTPPVPSPAVQRRKGNTFTVVPKHRSEEQGPGSESAGTPSAPYAHLGTLLKKRYPTSEEIQVIGGYLSLGRSCLSKTGSTGKKLKISFNESSLQSTFEYPSESTIWDSGEDEEEGGERRREHAGATSSGRMSIPRPTVTSSPIQSNTATDLSAYTPKHSVEFTAWDAHRLDESVDRGEDSSPCPEEVMLTPADSSSLSDFSSEPALYF